MKADNARQAQDQSVALVTGLLIILGTTGPG
jgi:hypothetical protein